MNSFLFDECALSQLELICAIFRAIPHHMKLRLGLFLVLLSVLSQLGLAQDNSVPSPDPSVPERPINWLKLIPNVARDQKTIWWRAPISLAKGKHLKPAIAITTATAALVAAVDVPSGKYFQGTTSFAGFNRAFSGSNTSVAMFAVPGAFYALSLLRKDSYGQHTFLLAGEAVLDSEILTSVMKDVDRRFKPAEVPLNGDFSQTWFRSHAGNVIQGIGSFPSGHTISAFSVATVFADRYPNPKWHKWVAYGIAGVVGFSRVSLQSHHPSDVFAAAALAYQIGHHVVLRRP
jgi:hypothetical protein